MKRSIHILVTALVCLLMLFPVTVCAETYHLSGTDMSIQVDESLWYVFTRDNIENNSELEELGITYDSMYDILYDNEAYMDAIAFYEDGEYVELIIRKRAIESGIANLSNYSDEKVLEMASELAQKQGTEEYCVYESQYKFARMEYIDSNLGYYICEFVTVVNKDNYTLTFQSTTPLGDGEYDEIKSIVDSIQFDVDASLKEGKTTSFWGNVITKAVIGAVIGGAVGAIVAIASKKKKNAQKNKEPSSAEGTEKN